MSAGASLIPRAAAPLLDEVRAGFPVVTLTGPRQSGKTTLACTVFAEKPYVSLEIPYEREFTLPDPHGFLARFPEGAIIDKVQHVPSLLSGIQSDVDAAGQMGRYILSASGRRGQALAGRDQLTLFLRHGAVSQIVRIES